MPLTYIEKILRSKVYDVAIESPLHFAPLLSEAWQNNIFLKREDLQPVFSFKIRGAYNKIASLSEQEQQHGVIAASAGNHAQGVALSANKLKINALIVMPKTTPEIKVNSVRDWGAEVVLFGDAFDDAYQHAKKLAKQRQMTFIHPYDDVDVIAGQATVAMEILRQKTDKIDAIFVPVGGGGLISGIAVYAKFVRPDIKIIGVEPNDSDCLNQALKAKKRVILKQVGLFADGVAVKQIGKENFKLARRWVDEVITVNTDEICAAIKDIFESNRSICEPAGALALAGLKKHIATTGCVDKNFVAIESGANINFDRLRYVAERTLSGEHREILLAVNIPEQAGSFLSFCKLLGNRSITEFNYRYFQAEQAQIFVGISSSGDKSDKVNIIATLEKKGFSVTDITHNELAKEHVRYMVGGHISKNFKEVIYSLQFPERPAALLRFLTSLGSQWNISLFHYRNHGAAFGKVLVGFEIAEHEKTALQVCFDALGFSYTEETDNPAYQLFSGK